MLLQFYYRFPSPQRTLWCVVALANRVDRLKRTTCMLSNSSSCSRRLDGRVYLDAMDPYLESNTLVGYASLIRLFFLDKKSICDR
jgi:hypothetical protein